MEKQGIYTVAVDYCIEHDILTAAEAFYFSCIFGTRIFYKAVSQKSTKSTKSTKSREKPCINFNI